MRLADIKTGEFYAIQRGPTVRKVYKVFVKTQATGFQSDFGTPAKSRSLPRTKSPCKVFVVTGTAEEVSITDRFQADQLYYVAPRYFVSTWADYEEAEERRRALRRATRKKELDRRRATTAAWAEAEDKLAFCPFAVSVSNRRLPPEGSQAEPTATVTIKKVALSQFGAIIDLLNSMES